uniref:Uncharacterized protein n=1 Tax=Bacillus cereus HuA4-10 TaxID=1053206 RepID=J8AYM3_BACCE|nr:hypothetical protein IGC_00564 [Bacillus cereus HuA4-10]
MFLIGDQPKIMKDLASIAGDFTLRFLLVFPYTYQLHERILALLPRYQDEQSNVNIAVSSD